MATSEMTAAPARTTRSRFEKALLLVVRMGLAYLFFIQLFWKLPPTFGCPADFAFTTGTIDAGMPLLIIGVSLLCIAFPARTFRAAILRCT